MNGDAHWKACQACEIGRIAHKKALYKGSQKPDILIIGEGPGRSEDVLGVPFCGPSGRLLAVALRQAAERIGVTPRVGITNLVACRPTDTVGGKNRIPTVQEVRNCSPRLIAVMRRYIPKVIVFAGNVPLQFGMPLIGLAFPEGYPGRICHIPHPAAVLRSGGESSERWEDYILKLEAIMKEAGYGQDQAGEKAASRSS